MKVKGLRKQVEYVESTKFTYEPLTMEMLEEFIKTVKSSCNNLPKEVTLTYPKAFFEALDDESFLSLLTNSDYRFVGGKETVDYIWDRYHSLDEE